ncbi:MAG: hypothetical protein KGJ44_12010, partial [Betaproteobacteria bacterium]|nr:hypothetical protein [Betaproteobacteria bacterium]
MASPVADAQAQDTRPSAATRRRIAYALTQRGRWAAAAVSLLALLSYALMLQLQANQHVPTVPWVGDTAGRLRVAPGDDAAWPGAAGHVIVGFADTALPALRELRSPRWQPQRALRERYFTDHALWAQAIAADRVSLRLDDGRLLDVPLAARGLTGIGPLFWLAGLVGLALVVVAAASFSTAPAVTSGLFLWAAFFIALALWCAGMDASRGPTWPPGVAEAITTTWQCADV